MKVAAAFIANGVGINGDSTIDVRAGFCSNWYLEDVPPHRADVPLLVVIELEDASEFGELTFRTDVVDEAGARVGAPTGGGAEMRLHPQPPGSPIYVPMAMNLECHFERVGAHRIQVYKLPDEERVADVRFGVAVVAS